MLSRTKEIVYVGVQTIAVVIKKVNAFKKWLNFLDFWDNFQPWYRPNIGRFWADTDTDIRPISAQKYRPNIGIVGPLFVYVYIKG